MTMMLQALCIKEHNRLAGGYLSFCSNNLNNPQMQNTRPISYSCYHRYNNRSFLSIYTALVKRNHSVTMVLPIGRMSKKLANILSYQKKSKADHLDVKLYKNSTRISTAIG